MLIKSALATTASILLLTACTAAGGVTKASPTATIQSKSSSSAYALIQSTLQVPANLRQAPFDQSRTVQVPKGWQVKLWARVDKARLAVWTPDKRLLVSRPDSGDIQLLTPKAKLAAQPQVTTLVNGLTQPHGMAFAGDTLYVAESNRVDAYTYASGQVGNRSTVVDNLPNASTSELRGAYAHALKSVAVGEDGAVYVSVGSTGNISAEDRSANPERATVLRVKDGKTTVWARGVRNGTGLSIAPDGSVWTAVNNRDQIAYPYADGYLQRGQVDQRYVNDHPLEPVAKLNRGRDLGWPYCNPDPDLTPGGADTKFSYTNRPYVRDQRLNVDGSKLNCSTLPNVEQGLPAHSAPLGMAFTTGASGLRSVGVGALVGVHGSWNRTPPREPRVVFFPWRNGTLQSAKTLLGGFQLADGSRWGRPVAAVQGPDGAVYVTDDLAGAVYRLIPPKS